MSRTLPTDKLCRVEPVGRPLRRGTLIAVGAAVALVAALGAGWLSVRLASDRVDAAAYDDAVALEDGVRPLVTDRVGELGTVTSVTVERTPDPPPARSFLLAPTGEDRARLSVVSSTRKAELAADGWLDDGRPFETIASDGRYVSLATVGVDRQQVEVHGRSMTFDELLTLTVEMQVGRDAMVQLPAGWSQLADTPMPPWTDGIGTYYDFLGGRRLGISVERASAGREALAAFAHVEPSDAIVQGGVGDWAYRMLPPSSGFVFGRGDAVVVLSGDFSDPEFLIVAHSLREMRPDEHPIADPDRSPF